MRTCYTVFHHDSGDLKRDLNVDRIHRVVGRVALKLDTPTIYLTTAQEVEDCLAKYPKIRFNPYDHETIVFPGRAGAVGLWVGTYLAFKSFLATDADTLMIFEDDVLVSENIFGVLGLYAAELPTDWDVMSFIVPWDTLPRYRPWHDIDDKEYICHMYQDWSTGGYMISRKGAEKAIKDIEENGISVPPDFFLYNYRYEGKEPEVKFNSFNIRPGLYCPVQLAPESNYSYIGATEVYKA